MSQKTLPNGWTKVRIESLKGILTPFHIFFVSIEQHDSRSKIAREPFHCMDTIACTAISFEEIQAKDCAAFQIARSIGRIVLAVPASDRNPHSLLRKIDRALSETPCTPPPASEAWARYFD